MLQSPASVPEMIPGSHRLEILFQQMDLLIKRYCQTYRCRCQQITDILATLIIIIIINMKYYKHSDNTDDRN